MENNISNHNNTENKEFKTLLINPKNIFNSMSKKILKCSKTTLNISTEIIDAILSENKDKLIKLSEKGLPDDLPILRALVWKINLGYLPINSNLWEKTFIEKRKLYNLYKDMFIKQIEKERREKNYKNREIIEQILKDVSRTGQNFSFFFQSTNKNILFSQEELLKMYKERRDCAFQNIDDYYLLEKENETHADVLTRILIIYSKFAPEISYHQGMNEILAPIYYCYSYDKLYIEEKEEFIEADSFWTFFNLMSQMKMSFDEFVIDGNRSNTENLYLLLKILDKDLVKHMDEYNIKFEFFAVRWFILLFSQEFNIGEILRLWDVIFSCENVYYFTYYVALAVFQIKRNKLIISDMVDFMVEIQNFENIEIDDILELVWKIQNKYEKQFLEIISKQKISDKGFITGGKIIYRRKTI